MVKLEDFEYIQSLLSWFKKKKKEKKNYKPFWETNYLKETSILFNDDFDYNIDGIEAEIISIDIMVSTFVVILFEVDLNSTLLKQTVLVDMVSKGILKCCVLYNQYLVVVGDLKFQKQIVII